MTAEPTSDRPDHFAEQSEDRADPPDHFDVLIVGAGLSGIGAGYHLQTESPQKNYVILEARDAIGGTWDLFRYPGIRSDSDMYTLGYSFRPWPSARSIAEGPSILKYIRQTASENGIDQKIRFNHRVTKASWSTEEQRWTVEAQRTDTDETVELTASFLFGCSGYYRYDEAFTPDFPGRDVFKGRIVHPQFWTEDIDYAGKRVVVIGSGATAVTLVPALAERAEHVTMLQRSPTWIVSLPAEDPLARKARRFLPARAAYALVRWRHVLLTMLSFELSRRRPEFVKRLLRKGLESRLPPGYDIDTHFTPRYNPWDQRLCLVPDDNLFVAIGEGRASIVTDQVDTFTERGIRLASGGELEADLVVTATGFNLLALGGMEVVVDAETIDISKTMAYRAMMLSGVPNMAITIGYTNASWTLKADLTCEYVCRLLNHMDKHGYTQCVPVNRDPSIAEQPLIDFSSGYVRRAIATFPRQGSRHPWRVYNNYALDIFSLRHAPIEDGVLEFSRATATDADEHREALAAAA